MSGTRAARPAPDRGSGAPPVVIGGESRSDIAPRPQNAAAEFTGSRRCGGAAGASHTLDPLDARDGYPRTCAAECGGRMTASQASSGAPSGRTSSSRLAIVVPGGSRDPRGAASNSYLGSMSGVALNEPVVGIAATPSGQRLLARRRRRWRVHVRRRALLRLDRQVTRSRADRRHRGDADPGTATGSSRADGGIFTFGDAHFYGSAGQRPLARADRRHRRDPIRTRLLARRLRRRRLHLRRRARSTDRPAARTLAAPIVGIAATRSGHGYWLGGLRRRRLHVRRRTLPRVRGRTRDHRADRRHLGDRLGRRLLARRSRRQHVLVRPRPAARHEVPRGRDTTRYCSRDDRGVTAGRLLGRVAGRHRRRVDKASAIAARRARSDDRVPAGALRMNAERTARHLAPLAWDGLLARAGQRLGGDPARRKPVPPPEPRRDRARRPAGGSRRSARTCSAARAPPPTPAPRTSRSCTRPSTATTCCCPRASSSGSAPRAAAGSSWWSRTSRSTWARRSRRPGRPARDPIVATNPAGAHC